MSIELRVMTPDALLYEGEVESVICDEPAGKEGFLPGHEPVMKMLSEGEVVIRDAEGRKTLLVKGGHIVTADDIQIFTPSAEWKKEGAEGDA